MFTKDMFKDVSNKILAEAVRNINYTYEIKQ